MTPAYVQVLGQHMDALAPELRALHSDYGVFQGRVSVETASAAVLRFGAKLAGFPSSDQRDVPFTFSTEPKGDYDLWTRRIGDEVMTSKLWATSDGLLAEHIGGTTGFSQLSVTKDGGLSQQLQRFRVFGCPAPMALAPDIVTREGAKPGQYTFEVTIRVPILKSVLFRYTGFLNV